MAQAITAPGDVVLCRTQLSHPRLRLPDGRWRHPLRPGRTGRGNFRAMERAVIHSIPKPIALVTAIPRTRRRTRLRLDFYRDLVAFAKKHELIVLSDLAYAEVYFDDDPPPVDPAGEWRDGRDGGVHLLVEDLLDGRVADGLRRRQRAADRGALAREIVSRLRRLHADPGGGGRCAQRSGRLHQGDARDLQSAVDALVESFGKAGWNIPRRPASMFAWVPIPEPFRASSARSSSPNC